MIAYFYLMKIAGLVHILEFRLFNAVIMFTCVWLSVREFKKHVRFDYFSGMINGIATGFMGTLIFAVFSFVYVMLIDPAFMEEVRANEMFGQFLNEYMVALVIFIEGITSAFLFTYVAMQGQKVPRVENSGAKFVD